MHPDDENEASPEIHEWGVQWYDENGKKHRGNDLPATQYFTGEQFWFVNGFLHRDDDKPAAIRKDVVEYRKNGLLHREIGPAVISQYGLEQFWLNGIKTSEFYKGLKIK